MIIGDSFMCFDVILILSISDITFHPLGNSNFLFHAIADILN